MKQTIIDYAISKALQSSCTYKVSAIGISRKGDILGCSINKRKICKKGMSIHAEVDLIKKYGRKIKTIIVCRVNNKGNVMPIDPCSTCLKIATRMGINIITVKTI